MGNKWISLIIIVALGINCRAELLWHLGDSQIKSNVQDTTLLQHKTEKGYSCINEIGGLFIPGKTALYHSPLGSNSYLLNKEYSKLNQWFFTFSTTQGYKFNHNIYLGACVELGLDCIKPIYRTDEDVPAIMLPLFTEVRVNLTKRKVAPFVDSRLGYSFLWKKVNLSYQRPSSGPLAELTFGIKTANIGKMAFAFSTGYRIQDFISAAKRTTEIGISYYNYPAGPYPGYLFDNKPPSNHTLYHQVIITIGLWF